MRILSIVLLFASQAFAATGSAPDSLAGLRSGHPRLLFTNEQLNAAVAAARIDPLRAKLHERILALAEDQIGTQPVRHELIGPRLLDKSRTALGRILTCAMAFRLSGDMRYALRAKKELFATAGFPDWNPSHFLDVAEMSLAFAIGYDWLYEQLQPAERERLKAALMKHSLSFASAAYAGLKPTDKRLRFVTAVNNWNQVCNAGLLAAALAIADEEPEVARLVVNGALRSLPVAMKASYWPDGAYPEGPAYWDYGTGYNVVAIAVLESALGTDFGLSRSPGLDRTALYRLNVEGPSGYAFNYADGRPAIGAQPEFTWLGRRFNLPSVLQHCRDALESELSKPTSMNRMMAMHAVWFPAPVGAPVPEPALDRYFRGPAELVMLRSAWNDPRALFVGFKAGRNDVSHAHLDLGSFILDADGVRWAHDLGPDNYNLPGYFGAERWSYYRLNNRSHNTLTPGNHLQSAVAVAPVVAFSSQVTKSFAITDLTGVYAGVAQSIRRGVALLDRARVLVQDELSAVKLGTVLKSRVVTGARVTLEDARHATLRQMDRMLRAEILAPEDGRFRVAPARPDTSRENANKGLTALTAEATANSPDMRIVILLTPVGERWHNFPGQPAVTPLADW